MTNTNNTAIESLRTFALNHNEIAFAHLVTAALNGEDWAVERVSEALDNMLFGHASTNDTDMLRVIRATDTARPDGAIAKSFEI